MASCLLYLAAVWISFFFLTDFKEKKAHFSNEYRRLIRVLLHPEINQKEAEYLNPESVCSVRFYFNKRTCSHFYRLNSCHTMMIMFANWKLNILLCFLCVCPCRSVTQAAACVWRANTLYPGVPSAWRTVWRGGARWAGATDRWAAATQMLISSFVRASGLWSCFW